MKQTNLVFSCRKCGHLLFVGRNIKSVEGLLETDCPNCGEEAEGLWRLERLGNYDEEFKDDPDEEDDYQL